VSTGFEPRRLEAQYSFLDDCPPALLPFVVPLPSGTLRKRIAALVRWREALLAGTLPENGEWPRPTVEQPIRQTLEQLGIAPFCTNQPELVDALLADIFKAFAAEAQTLDVAERKREPSDGILAAWRERVRAWQAIAEVFGDLGQLLGRGWDLSLGVLERSGWLEVARLRALLEALPEFREIVRSLGRLQHSENGKSLAETFFEKVRRLEEESREIVTPLAPTETRGIERSGEIDRMLPAEAAMLGHPLLRTLWHARRAERNLLAYRLEGVTTERRLVERESQRAVQRERPRPERGPIIAIVDTSGSMRGPRENIAKALVLEALRTALDERRRCFVYAYSGPGQIVEHELALSPEGLGGLLAFLLFSFGGGNDEAFVLRRVLARLREEAWRCADVLFVSDGEWPVSAELESAVRAVRESGVRFHGIQIGNRGESGLHRICDPVHSFDDWSAARGF
jgi:uncharacterized protein with von Willebrand factor type A (vWA) domain